MFRCVAAASALFVMSSEASAGPDVRFELNAEHRTRYQSMEGRFRSGAVGSDQNIAQRTLIGAELGIGRIIIGGELQDSRAYLTDDGSALSTVLVNAAEPLQAYLAIDASGLGGADEARLTLGRWTEKIGSGRFISPNQFRNTVNGFSGALWTWRKEETEWKAFLSVPVDRRPNDFDALLDNEIQIDDESDEQIVWGLFHRRPLPAGLTGDLFYFGFDEDANSATGLDRTLHTPGFRLATKPAVNAIDFEVEAALQFGSTRDVTIPNAVEADVFAQVVHAEIGFTYDAPWNTRVAIEYDFASGDEEPGGDVQTFDNLFGPIRANFGPTDIYAAVGRDNISSPAMKFTVTPDEKSDGLLRYRAFFLDEPTAPWPRAGVVDPTGASGDFIGHQVDARARYRIIPGRVMVEAGGAILIKGPYALDVPGATGDPAVYYGYADIVLSF